MIPIRNNGCYCFTLEVVDTVDIFTRPMYKQIIVHSLNHFIDNKGLVVYGWCLMSNKLSLVCQSAGFTSLINLFTEFIAFTSKKIVDAIQRNPDNRNNWLAKHFENKSGEMDDNPSCWSEISTVAEIDISNPKSMAEYLESIHSQPVKDRIVHDASDYVYSSARDYAIHSGLVKITKPASVETLLYEMENRKNSFRINYQ